MAFLKVHKLKETTSTNAQAFKLAKSGGEGCVVAESQTAGRGRYNRKWFSDPGNLYCSLFLRPDISPHAAPQLTFVMALAAQELLEDYLREKTQLKWPNDIWVRSKKILGILTAVETKDEKLEFVVLGIGINVNQDIFPKEIADIAISMRQVKNLNTNLDDLLEAFLIIFEKWYQKYLNEGFLTIKQIWEDKSGFIGKNIVIQDGDQKIKGIVKSLKEDGALVLEITEGKLQTVYAGDVTCF